MKTKIYVMTHKKFDVPGDPTYVPLQVGRALKEDLGYTGDDTGDSISALNPYYSELTGVYWVWKNVTDADNIGICHYRRYLLNDLEQPFTSREAEALLQHYDILTSKRLTLNYPYAYGFRQNHSPRDLDTACSVIRRMYPDFYPLFAHRLEEKHTYFGNMMICPAPLFHAYCSFLFPIFKAMHPLLDLDSYDDYHKRLYGFLSEFLLMVWCDQQQLRVKECKVGLIGEKKETTEAVSHLWDLLASGKIREAKLYFVSLHQKRPDILMEASDIHGHLHLCLQAISTCEYELADNGHILLPIRQLYGPDLMNWLQQLNTAALSFSTLPPRPKQMSFLQRPDVSSSAIAIALRLHCPNADMRQTITENIGTACQRKLPEI